VGKEGMACLDHQEEALLPDQAAAHLASRMEEVAFLLWCEKKKNDTIFIVPYLGNRA
jgi:hypothetical protein